MTCMHACLHGHACTHPPAHARRLLRVYQAYCPGCATEAVAVHCRQEAGGVYWHDIALLHGTRSPRTSHHRRVIKGSSVPEHDEGARGGREAVRLRHKSERRGRQGSHLIHHAYVADGAVSVRACACVRACDGYTCIHTYVDASIDHRVMCKVRLTGITHTHTHSRTHTHTRCAYIHPWSTSSRHCQHPKAGFDAIGEVLTRTECGLVACVDSIRNAERRSAQSGEEQAVLRIGFAARLCRAALPVAMCSYGLCMRACVCS